MAARFLLPIVVVAAAAALAGCGSSASESAVLSRDVAARLARDSEAVAVSVGRGDSCTALRQARALRASIERAIADRRVPAELQLELRQRASSLVKAIDCVATLRADSGGRRDDSRRGDRGHHGEEEHEEEDD